jgi:hypothetical protein
MSRRSLLAALVSSVSLCAERVRAQPKVYLAADDPVAKALAYTEHASTISPTAEPLFKPGHLCSNCKFFQSAQASGNYAPCTVFQGKFVNKEGWCRAWQAKA